MTASLGTSTDFLTGDGVRLHYEDEGMGYPLILLNGLWGDVGQWDRQMPALSARYRCLRLEHRGTGQSEKWQGRYSYERHADDVVELMDGLGLKRAVLLGVCHGAMAALTTAFRYPARVTALAVNGAQMRRSARQFCIFEGWLRMIRTAGFPAFYRSAMLPVLFGDAWLERNHDRLEEVAQAVADRQVTEVSLAMIEACIRYGFSDAQLATIRQPALVIAGDEDGFIPVCHLKEDAARLPSAQFHVIAGSGHFPQRERPEIYTGLLVAFLEAVLAR